MDHDIILERIGGRWYATIDGEIRETLFFGVTPAHIVAREMRRDFPGRRVRVRGADD